MIASAHGNDVDATAPDHSSIAVRLVAQALADQRGLLGAFKRFTPPAFHDEWFALCQYEQMLAAIEHEWVSRAQKGWLSCAPKGWLGWITCVQKGWPGWLPRAPKGHTKWTYAAEHIARSSPLRQLGGVCAANGTARILRFHCAFILLACVGAHGEQHKLGAPSRVHPIRHLPGPHFGLRMFSLPSYLQPYVEMYIYLLDIISLDLYIFTYLYIYIIVLIRVYLAKFWDAFNDIHPL